MKKLITICLAAIIILAATEPLRADWQRSPAPDVDKEFISGNPGLQPGLLPQDNSCWMATASNMLAGTGYGNGTTLQVRAEDIYLDMLNWRVSIDPTNTHGVRDGGWVDNALNWWLGSANNLWDGTHAGYAANPYTVVTPYGSKGFTPWADTNGASFIGNELREYRTLSIGVRWPRLFVFGNPSGGHAITAWGDSGTSANLTANPAQIILADSDRDNGGDFQTYTYDSYTNPNPDPGRFNEGNGWYINYNNNHPYIVYLVTLSSTDSPVDPHDGPTQKVVGSLKRHQPRLQRATDLHYEAYTDYDILGYRTEIDWTTDNDPSITESNAHQNKHPGFTTTRDTIHVDWDLSDNPVPYCKDVTITTEFILQNWNGIDYDDVYFTYGTGAAGSALPSFGWNIDTPQLADVNIVDITGGFVIGAFDVYDFSGEPNLLCQYRLIHQYPYTQDPERHTFTLRGPNGRCADFDDLAEGSSYRVGDVFETQGYTVTCREFFLPDGSMTSGEAYVNMASASGGTGLELQLYSVNAEFDFGSQVPCVSFLFAEYGANINMEVNNDFRNVENFADMNGLTVGGCFVTVTNGANAGIVLIQGQINQFKLGGQELAIDEVCPFCEDTDRYVATHFRFGHSYGMLDAKSLWQFNDWMTSSPYRAVLSQREPFELTLDWEGRLPYPESNILPADQIPDAPECTVYLEADLNKDCCVDFKDYAIFADQWLQCTTPEGRRE